MHRFFLFIIGLAAAAFALPKVLAHHTRVEIMQLAWCSSTGSPAPDSGLLAMHCAICPALLAGVALMLVSIAVPSNWFSLSRLKAQST